MDMVEKGGRFCFVTECPTPPAKYGRIRKAEAARAQRRMLPPEEQTPHPAKGGVSRILRRKRAARQKALARPEARNVKDILKEHDGSNFSPAQRSVVRNVKTYTQDKRLVSRFQKSADVHGEVGSAGVSRPPNYTLARGTTTIPYGQYESQEIVDGVNTHRQYALNSQNSQTLHRACAKENVAQTKHRYKNRWKQNLYSDHVAADKILDHGSRAGDRLARDEHFTFHQPVQSVQIEKPVNTCFVRGSDAMVFQRDWTCTEDQGSRRRRRAR